MKGSIEDTQMADKLSPEDKEAATKAISDALSWLEHNQMAEKEEFVHKQKEVEGICSPIVSKVYEGGGGGSGGMPGGMPSGGAPPPNAPNIEEVD
jgi:L1 cell adhesion molecule like protein